MPSAAALVNVATMNSPALVGSNSNGLKLSVSTLMTLKEAISTLIDTLKVEDIVELTEQARSHMQATHLKWLFSFLRLERMMYFLKGFRDQYQSGEYGPRAAIQQGELKAAYKEWAYANMQGLYPSELYALTDYLLAKLNHRSGTLIALHRSRLLAFVESVEKAVEPYKLVHQFVKRVREKRAHRLVEEATTQAGQERVQGQIDNAV